jgi:hypothetical protein
MLEQQQPVTTSLKVAKLIREETSKIFDDFTNIF